MFTSLSVYALLDAMSGAIFVKNEDLRFVYVNKAYEEMFGVRKEDMIGRTVLEVSHLPEADREFYQAEDARMIQRCEVSHHIFDYLFGDGKIHTCLYWSSGFVQENGLRGLVGVVVDITRQSQTIAALKRDLLRATREKKKTEEKSAIDALTKVHNRRSFQAYLKKYAALSAKNGASFSCVMLDIDYFKQVNDTYGHQAGDKVLRQIGKILKSRLRGNDVVCRYGGEEFVLLLPGSGLNQALLVAERTLKLIAEKVRLPGGKSVTVSAGCSEYQAGEDEVEFIRRADVALYAAKAAGRNCCRALSQGLKPAP